MTTTDTSRIAYTKAEAAQKVGLSVDSISAAIANGHLAAKKYGTKPLVGHAALMEWFESLEDA